MLDCFLQQLGDDFYVLMDRYHLEKNEENRLLLCNLIDKILQVDCCVDVLEMRRVRFLSFFISKLDDIFSQKKPEKKSILQKRYVLALICFLLGLLTFRKKNEDLVDDSVVRNSEDFLATADAEVSVEANADAFVEGVVKAEVFGEIEAEALGEIEAEALGEIEAEAVVIGAGSELLGAFEAEAHAQADLFHEAIVDLPEEVLPLQESFAGTIQQSRSWGDALYDASSYLFVGLATAGFSFWAMADSEAEASIYAEF